MQLADFMNCIRARTIPPEPPDGLATDGYSCFIFNDDTWRNFWEARDECTKMFNMWAIVTQDFAKRLTKWIGPRTILEVMAGAGWLARALADQGISVTATDNYIWQKWTRSNNGNLFKPVYPIKRYRAENAVKRIPADVLLVSWPPYSDSTICRVCEAWGCERPIIYIGEGEGGCNAPDEFFARFNVNDIDIPLMSWDGLHDQVLIGHWIPFG